VTPAAFVDFYVVPLVDDAGEPGMPPDQAANDDGGDEDDDEEGFR
jgi:hypothetical protein